MCVYQELPPPIIPATSLDPAAVDLVACDYQADRSVPDRVELAGGDDGSILTFDTETKASCRKRVPVDRPLEVIGSTRAMQDFILGANSDLFCFGPVPGLDGVFRIADEVEFGPRPGSPSEVDVNGKWPAAVLLRLASLVQHIVFDLNVLS